MFLFESIFRPTGGNLFGKSHTIEKLELDSHRLSQTYTSKNNRSDQMTIFDKLEKMGLYIE